jgi:UDP-GlcNAc3NAcA epimerase
MLGSHSEFTMKIVTIIGARPQFIKAAALSREFAKHSCIKEIIIHTGQHFDKNMSDVFFEEMQIPRPNYHLNINGLGHGAMTGQMLEGIEKILIDERPDFVLVYGDTNSTLAGALASKKLHLKLVHVEAGLRSFNMLMPEEINRVLTDRISDILFVPTKQAIQNLDKEGFENFDCEIVNCGDIMQDAALFYSKRAAEKSTIIQTLGLESSSFVLATIHRAENTDDLKRLVSIVGALNEINKTFKVVSPVHPRTRAIFEKNNIKTDFVCIDPVGYFDMIQLMSNCSLICTDSGGLQKEAYFFNKYCITFRDQTEWVELVENGYNRITGANKDFILDAFGYFKEKPFHKATELYGAGNASKTIADFLIKQN